MAASLHQLTTLRSVIGRTQQIDAEAGRYAEAFLSSLWLDNYLKKYATGQIFTEGTKNISGQKVLFSIYVLHILEFSPKYDEMKLHSTLN